MCAAAGALTGALIGHTIQAEEADRTAPPPPHGYPWARRSGNRRWCRGEDDVAGPQRLQNSLGVRGAVQREYVRRRGRGPHRGDKLFEALPQGEYTFRYRLRASMAGTFRVGPAILESMYAPEFTAASTGAVLMIK